MIETREQLADALESLANEIRNSECATVELTQTKKKIRMGIGSNPSFPCASTYRVDFEVGTKAGRLRIVDASAAEAKT